MRTFPALWLASALACLLAAPAPAATEEAATEKALHLVRRGEIDDAIRLLRDHLKDHAKEVEARVLLGRLLDFDGRPDEAVASWEAGVVDGAEDAFPLLTSIGEVRLRQGRDGPTMAHRRGMVTASPSKDADAEARFKVARLAEAATAYERARRLRPDEPDAATALASVYSAQGRHDDAAGVWRSLVGREPKNAGYTLRLALATRDAGHREESTRLLERAIELDPRLAEAHEALADSREEAGRAAEAEQSRKRAAFFKSLPAFSSLPYSEENERAIAGLRREEDLSKLLEDPSARAAELLAVLCWSHPHDESEARAFNSLESRGEATTPLLQSLLKDARSTCTIKSTAHILGRRKADGLLGFLLARLPGDLRGFGMDMDIAGSLDDLGDPRAVGPLAEVLNSGEGEESDGGPLMDRNLAKARAAMALGRFETPDARRALEAGAANPRIAPYCLAALYRITKDPAQALALEKAVGQDDDLAAFLLSRYLVEKVGTDPAKTLASTWTQRLEKRREEERSKQAEPPEPE